MVSEIDIYVAKRKMSLKNSNYCLSFVSTLWNGEVIMCTFDNLQNKICSLFCIQKLDEDSFSQLERIVKEFLNELSCEAVAKAADEKVAKAAAEKIKAEKIIADNIEKIKKKNLTHQIK